MPVCAQHGVDQDDRCAICETERRACVADAERRAKERSRQRSDKDTDKAFRATLWLTSNVTEPMLRSLFVRGALRRFAAMAPERIEAVRQRAGVTRAAG